MSAVSTEGRRYHVHPKDIDGVRFIQLSVLNDEEQLVTRDHFTLDEGRSFAAQFIVAAEC